MIGHEEAIRTARSLIGTPYKELDCINLIKKVIRTAPGGVPGYTTAGTNTLWNSYEASGKYRDLTWRQEGLTAAAGTSSVSPSASHLPHGGRQDAQAGMLAFKRNGTDVHHVGIVAERPQCGMQRGGDRESQGAEGDYASSPDGDGLTVIHSSSAKGCVVETALDSSWNLLGIHRYIEVQELPKSAAPTAPSGGSLEDETEDTQMEAYKMKVVASSLNVRNEPGIGGTRIGRLSEGTVVTVQAEMDSDWKFITYGDSGSGYVDGSYLGEYVAPDEPETKKVTIIDSAGNHFCPVGDWRVLIGSVD